MNQIVTRQKIYRIFGSMPKTSLNVSLTLQKQKTNRFFKKSFGGYSHLLLTITNHFYFYSDICACVKRI